MTGNDGSQSGQLFLGIDRAGGVRRRAENQQAGFRRDGCLQLFGGHLEVLFDAGTDDDGSTVGQFDHFGIAHPVRSRYNHFIALVHQGQDGVADRLLGTVGAADLCGGVVQSILVFQLGHDGIAQGRITGYGRIAREVVVDGFLGSFLDVVGRIEVGFAYTQVDDIDPLCLQFTTFL